MAAGGTIYFTLTQPPQPIWSEQLNAEDTREQLAVLDAKAL